jgi:hypothetical protein
MAAKSKRGVSIAADRKSVRIDINGRLSAAQLGELIALLAQVRSGMDPDGHLEIDDRAQEEAFARYEPAPVASGLDLGGVRLWLRSRGQGWLAFDLTRRQTLAMLMSMSSAAGNLDYAIGRLAPSPFAPSTH